MEKINNISNSSWYMGKTCKIEYHFDNKDARKILQEIGKEMALKMLEEMLVIRHFEARGQQAYQMGKVWGFYHAYTGQEAIQTGAVHAIGAKKNLWVTTYRCHALALLLGMTPEEGMCELYGKENGNAGGRGGSMHLYTDNMFGGNGIVGGQWPMGAGLAFSLQYKGIKDEVAVCFGGEASVMQGTFHESHNLAALWNLPMITVIENNQYGMGTQVERAIAHLPVGENMAKAYGIKSFTVDGMDVCQTYGIFKEAKEYVLKEQRPVIIEAICQRFKGHSISDAANYRTKEELQEIMKRDPIGILQGYLMEAGWIDDNAFQRLDDAVKQVVLDAMKVADESADPPLTSLEEGVMVDE